MNKAIKSYLQKWWQSHVFGLLGSMVGSIWGGFTAPAPLWHYIAMQAVFLFVIQLVIIPMIAYKLHKKSSHQ